jgi:hypothetical protein
MRHTQYMLCVNPLPSVFSNILPAEIRFRQETGVNKSDDICFYNILPEKVLFVKIAKKNGPNIIFDSVCYSRDEGET